MPSLPHRVRRLAFQVRATSPEEALGLRKELRDQMEAALFAAIERAFEDAGSPDEIVHLPRLHVRARISGAGEVAGELAQQIEQELRRELTSTRTRAGQGSSPSSSAGSAGSIIAGLIPRSTRGLFEGEPSESPLARVRMLLHYLETGSISWPLANAGSAAVRSELREAAGADLLEVLGRSAGAPASFSSRVAFWFRWLQLLPEARWPDVARAAGSRSIEQSARLVEIVMALSGEQVASLSRYVRLQLAAAAIALALREVELADSTELAALVLHALEETDPRHASQPGGGTGAHDRVAGGEDERECAEEEGSVRAASSLISRLPEPAATAFRDWLAAPSPRHAASESVGTTRAGAVHAAVASTSTPALFPPPRSGPSGSGSRAERASPPEELLGARSEPALAARVASTAGAELRSRTFGQMVHHAGLVLLHPFLPRFFESTAVKEAGAPALLAGQLPRAAALLHLLATGDEDVLELELDFVKILLGLSLDAQLPVSEGLVLPSDREEVDALLAAVIGHWRALKSTSAAGLRASFLQRRGLVREEEQGFRLQVEPAPFDMLLDQLPWGIGTVRLPWMKKPLFTDWPSP